MRIIKEGVLPEPDHYFGVCRRCGAEVIYSVREAEVHGEPNQPDRYWIRCPTLLCAARIFNSRIAKYKEINSG